MELLNKLKQGNYAIIASNGYSSYDNGIRPVIDRINEDLSFFKDLIVADKIIGKASAMLLCLSGVKEVYCVVLSKAGESILKEYNVTYHYENLVDYIVNRKGDGMCPMEKTVENINDLNEAYEALNRKIKEINNG